MSDLTPINIAFAALAQTDLGRELKGHPSFGHVAFKIYAGGLNFVEGMLEALLPPPQNDDIRLDLNRKCEDEPDARTIWVREAMAETRRRRREQFATYTRKAG